MIDWHSHILPKMDDGSRDVAESIALLEMLGKQGVDTVAATSHFYADNESVKRFLERRELSYQALDSAKKEGLPRVMLGAEVRYYPGISKLEGLEDLMIKGSRMLLLEMPFSHWTEYTLKEITAIAGAGKWELVLAHVERYLKYQNTKVWDRLLDSGVLIQANASFFAELGTRQKAISMLDKGYIQFIGSDAHNLATRSPKIDKAAEVISRRLGNEFLAQMSEYGYSKLL